jgi:hypothetical protein
LNIAYHLWHFFMTAFRKLVAFVFKKKGRWLLLDTVLAVKCAHQIGPFSHPSIRRRQQAQFSKRYRKRNQIGRGWMRFISSVYTYYYYYYCLNNICA